MGLALSQAIVAVVLGERVPPHVALACFAAEAVLAWLALALLVGAATQLPGLRAAARDRGLRQAVLLTGVGLFAGGSWLFTDDVTGRPGLVLAGWLAGHVLAVGVLQRLLRASGRLPAEGRDAFATRALLASFLPIGCLVAIHRVAWADAAAHPLAFALLQGAASLAGVTLALVLPWPARSGSRAGAGGRAAALAGRVAVAAAILAALSSALDEAGPRRPWRDGRPSEPAAAAAAGAPNLVLVSIDTLGSRHVGSYGYERDTTPSLDALAAEGALFERMTATAPWTLPSHGTLFTGRYPGDLAGYRIAGTPSLAPLLRDRGYRTAAFTAGYVMGETYFGEGFDFFADDYEEAYVLGLAPTFLQAGLRLRRGIRHLRVGFPPLNPVNHWRLEGGGVSAFAGPYPPAEAAADWIRERGTNGPFFLFFHTFGAHEYYLATAEMRRGADRWAGDYRGWLRATSLRFGSRMPEAEEDLRYLVALYDASIRSSDAALGMLLDALEAAGLAENTLVVVTSDHGEGFRPDLGRTWHLGRLHDDLLSVPLVMRMPGRIPPGLRLSAQASGVDVFPTALTLLGVDAPDGVRGQSLVPLLGGVAGATLREEAFSQVADHDPARHGSAVRTREYKYIRTRHAGEELYDLARDPGEARNLAPASFRRRSNAALGLRDRLETFEQTVSQETPDLDEQMAEQLRALGYVDGP